MMWTSAIGRKLKTIGDTFNCHYIGSQLRYVADQLNTFNTRCLFVGLYKLVFITWYI